MKNGKVLKIEVREGEGFYRESVLTIGNASLNIREVFVTNGDVREIPSGNGR